MGIDLFSFFLGGLVGFVLLGFAVYIFYRWKLRKMMNSFDKQAEQLGRTMHNMMNDFDNDLNNSQNFDNDVINEDVIIDDKENSE